MISHPMTTPTPESVRLEYQEVCTTWRSLGARRFRLLSLLRAATVVGVSVDWQGLPAWAVGLLGLAVTVALATYNARNDQHYDELVARAAELERMMGLHGGSFDHRPRPWFQPTLPGLGIGVPIEHRWPVSLVYAAVATTWLTLTLSPLGELPLTGGLALSVVGSTWAWLQRERARQRGQLRENVLDWASRLQSLTTASASETDKSLQVLASDIVRQLPSPGVPPSPDALARRHDNTLKKLQFHVQRVVPSEDPDEIGLDRAAHVLAGATNLPARWIYDVCTGRR